ncbi:ATP synthase subunit I [Mycobacterium sp. M1]|uniref:ATP synthase subunit I n=1 Tax=Mycolicibacter acidiphilus TaxID=2835306 RepID=A0ABS5RQZ3_9MYCO|nr:ATP synthase subunit I [Mycolicibacter acidiphilus]MBS9535384.1 ATP synthase subunit I [Mycolicibacter acidiphilus]
MTTPAQDAPLVLPAVVFRPVRLGLICVALAAVALVGAQYLHRPLLGVFFGVGLALGLANALLVRRSVQNITAGDHPLKSKMAMNSAARLGVISVIALAIAYVFKPNGLGVVFGLALFELILVASTALPVMKKLRSAAAAGAAGDGVEGTAH